MANALSEAVMQVHGGEISAKRELQQTMLSATSRIDDSRSASSTSTRGMNSQMQSSTSGLISSYSVIDISRSGGSYHAVLDVQLPVYKASSVHQSRKKLAIYPVETPGYEYSIGERRLGAEDLSEQLTQSLVSMTVQSGRFSVLDRDMRATIEREHGFVSSSDVPMSQKVVIGQTLGADFLLVTRLRTLDIGVQTRISSLTGEAIRKTTGSAVLEARIVMPATGQLMWSHTLEMEPGDFTDTGRPQRVVTDLARKLVSSALEAIYPLRVVEGMDQHAVINQGGQLLRIGQRFSVFAVGKRYTDPYHQGSLGARERWVADVEVTFVGPKTSNIRVLKGSIKGDGHVLRTLPLVSAATGQVGGSPRGQRAGLSNKRPMVCFPGDPC